MFSDPDDDGNKEPLCRVGSQWRGDKKGYFWHGIFGPANGSPPPTVKQLIEEMFIDLGISQTVVRNLVEDQ